VISLPHPTLVVLSFEEEIRLKKKGMENNGGEKRGSKECVLKSTDRDKETEVTILT